MDLTKWRCQHVSLSLNTPWAHCNHAQYSNVQECWHLMADIYKPLVYTFLQIAVGLWSISIIWNESTTFNIPKMLKVNGGGGDALIYFGEYVAKSQLVKLSMKTGRQENRGKVSLICLTPKVYKQIMLWFNRGLCVSSPPGVLSSPGGCVSNHWRHWLLALTSHLL